MNEKVVAKIENAIFKVVEKVSKKGVPYYSIIAVLNGKEVQVGFLDAYIEVALLRAGVKFNY